jgi:hypothetical protein
MGIAWATTPFVTWATEFLDYDNDGWLDLVAIDGHVFPEVDQHQWGTSYAQRPYLLHNLKNGAKFAMVPAVEGTGLAVVVSGRGAAAGICLTTKNRCGGQLHGSAAGVAAKCERG